VYYCSDSGNIAPGINHGFGILEFFRNRLRAQIKQMPLELFQLALELIGAHLSIMLRFHLKNPLLQ